MDFNKFNTFIFDLDGTVWCWLKLYPGVERAIDKLHDQGKQVLYVTNNTLLSRKGLAKKLNLMGLEAKEKDVIHPGVAAVEYLREKKGKALVFGEGLKEDLKEAGIRTSSKLPARYLLIGHDPKFDYKKLEVSLEAVERGADILATAKGKFFVVGNHHIPGTGVLVEVIEYESSKKAILLGKPSNLMRQLVQLEINSPRKETVLVGDELNSDILLGKKAGWFTVLVRTGVDRKASKSIRPDLVVNSVADVRI